MPGLSVPRASLVINLAAELMTGTEPVDSFPANGMWINLVRLTDQAIREYAAADAVFAAWEGNELTITLYYRGIGHLETAITATHRAVYSGKTLRSQGFGRSAKSMAGRHEKALNELRNVIHHTDSRLRNGRIEEGQPLMLFAGVDRMTFGSATMTYVDLAACIEACYRQVETVRGPSE